jgi:ABC-type transport system involved in multi-copper enzyme maturation permease subunit
MQAVYALTLRQLSGKWRIVIMTILAIMPLILTLNLLGDNDAISVLEYENLMISSMLAGAFGPLIMLATAAAAFGNEVDDRTLANLTISPVPRWKIALPKLLGTITVSGPFIVLSALVTSHLAFGGDVRATIAVGAGALALVVMYASMFTWLGLVSTQAIGLGLLYIVLWEGFFSGFIAGVRLLSIRFYAIAVMRVIDPRRFAEGEVVSTTVGLVMTAVVIAGFLGLTIRKLRTMDVP